MCSRATPFGIFATVGLATGAHKAIEEREERWARLEIDGDVLWRIHGKVLSVLRTEPSSKFAINSSAYETMNGLRFLQRSQVGNAFSFRLVSFKRSPHLDAVFRDRHCSKTRYEYAKEIANSTEGLDIEDAYEFLDRLIDADFLRSTIDVSAIGWDNVDDYLAQFDSDPSTLRKELTLLREISTRIGQRRKFDFRQVQPIAAEIEKLLSDYGIAAKKGHVVQVDAFESTQRISLSPKSKQKLSDAIRRLTLFTSRERNESLKNFSKNFETRFGESFVPLMKALDPETGIPFGYSQTHIKWLGGMTIQPRNSRRSNSKEFLHSFHSSLQTSPYEIDLAQLPEPTREGETEELQAAPSVTANITIVPSDPGGEETIILNYVSGPSSANLFARFAAREPIVKEFYQSLLAREQSDTEEAIHAEICHIPRPRMINVLRRPEAHTYELVISGRPTVDAEHQIHLSDLVVGVIHGNIVLWSMKNNRRIIPTLHSAYNQYHQENLGIFQFLCAVGRQSFFIPNFSWGEETARYSRLPRVRVGQVILSPQRWLIRRDVLKKHIQTSATKDPQALRQYLTDLGVPRRFAVEQFDQLLEIDLLSETSLRLFVDAAKGSDTLQIRESCYEHLQAGTVREWRHSELLVPLQVLGKKDQITSLEASYGFGNVNVGQHLSVEAGCEDWIYLKIYGGEHYVANLLVTTIFPIIALAINDKIISNWFFIRYADPDHHIRLRVKGAHKSVYSFIQVLIQDHLSPRFRAHELAGIKTDQYLPEVHRYGGLRNMHFAEEMFRLDSVFCIHALRLLQSDAGAELEWSVLIHSVIIILFTLFSGSRDELLSLAEQQRSMFKQELNVTGAVFDHIGKQYRERRQRMERMLQIPFDGFHPKLRSAVDELIDSIRALVAAHSVSTADLTRMLPSLVHMHCNRLMTFPSRYQEYVLWDYLSRGLRSVIAQGDLIEPKA